MPVVLSAASHYCDVYAPGSYQVIDCLCADGADEGQQKLDDEDDEDNLELHGSVAVTVW